MNPIIKKAMSIAKGQPAVKPGRSTASLVVPYTVAGPSRRTSPRAPSPAPKRK